MAGTQIRVDIDDRAAKEALAGIRDRALDLRDAFEEIGSMMVASTLHRFETETGPDGAGWEPSYRAEHGGGQTLTDTGRLRDSIVFSAERDSVTVGTNVIYAAIHQYGGAITAKTSRGLVFPVGGRGRGANRQEWVTKQSVTLPARPFLGVDPGDRVEITEILRDHIQGAR